MDNSPVDPFTYIRVMKQTRRRRKYFFGTVLIYIPALLITHKISPTNRAMGTVFVIWVVLLIIVTILAALSKCPRCGNYFHMHGITLLFLRKCLHCQLHINTVKIT
jgi:heme A synthase